MIERKGGKESGSGQSGIGSRNVASISLAAVFISSLSVERYIISETVMEIARFVTLNAVRLAKGRFATAINGHFQKASSAGPRDERTIVSTHRAQVRQL